jgi:threonine dehydrogenase-like Zn-dependent dehydrogenase
LKRSAASPVWGKSSDGRSNSVADPAGRWYWGLMLALFFDGDKARVTDRPPPSASPDMALIRMSRAGICNTDLEITKGYMGYRGVLGHELTGRVVEGPSAWLGKRVAAEINFACGACPACARRLGRHCPTRTVMGILGADGAFAELVAVPVSNLHEVPDAVSDDHAAFIEPLAAAFEILEQVHVEPGAACVVLGDGKLGLLVAQVLFQAGAEVLVVGKHPDKLARARDRGIRTVTQDAFTGEPADLVVEATGTAKGFEAAVRSTRPRGTLVLKSTVAAAAEMRLAPLVINEITVKGSRCGSFPPAIRALASGSIDVSGLISAKLPLREAERALALAASPGVLKVLLENER